MKIESYKCDNCGQVTQTATSLRVGRKESIDLCTPCSKNMTVFDFGLRFKDTNKEE